MNQNDGARASLGLPLVNLFCLLLLFSLPLLARNMNELLLYAWELIVLLLPWGKSDKSPLSYQSFPATGHIRFYQYHQSEPLFHHTKKGVQALIYIKVTPI